MVLLSRYEDLLMEIDYVEIKDHVHLPDGYKGFYSDDLILIDKKLSDAEKLENLF